MIVVVASVLLVVDGAGCGASSREVTIPRAQQTDLADAFALLRSLGLRVAIDGATADSSLRPAGVARMSPPAGTRVRVGTIVALTPSDLGPAGSPAVLTSHPRYRTPNFIGATAALAIGWASRHDMFWSIPRLPPLAASDARSLFAAYTVTSQTPKPGATIAQGIMVGRSFRPTPLTLTLKP